MLVSLAPPQMLLEIAGVVPAEVVHRASLAALADRFATVIETGDAIPD